MPQKSRALRGEAERSAMEMLKSRAAMIGEASVARQRRDDLAEQHATAAAEYATTYDKARAAGWSVDELSKLGLPDPGATADSTRRRRARPAETA